MAEPNDSLDKIKMDALFYQATIGILIVNQQSVILSSNPHLQKQFGYAQEELTGQPVEILIPMPFRDKHVNHRNGFQEHPQNRPMGLGLNLQGQHKDGSVFPVEISLSHVQTETEKYVLAFINDISIRKKQEDQLKQQQIEINRINQELEKRVSDRTKMLQEILIELEQSKIELEEALSKERELNEMKSAFVTLASHEFKTPLATILSSASLVEKYIREEEQPQRKKHTDRIKSSVRNLNNILEDFLSLGKLEEHKITPENSEFMLRELIQFVCQELEDMRKPGQHIQLDCDHKLAICSDSRIIQNVLVNIVGNAQKYSGENTSIHIRAVQKENMLLLSVSDEGIGISVEDQKKLFQKFFRAKEAANIQGTGLGLYIVSRYLELIHGSIRCESIPGKGSTFYIEIPVL